MPESAVIARPRLVLASSSPQRETLLRQVGIHPLLKPSGFDEQALVDESAGALVERLARGKASAVAAGKDLTVGADTMVVVDDRPLGKAADIAEAASMLGQLSGRTHQVMTGVAVVCHDRVVSSVTSTSVRFRPLGVDEIDWYLSTGEWEDKAGAYALQGKGAVLVESIQGDYNNVVGLPLTELDRLLGTFGRPLRSWMGQDVGS